MNFNGRTREQTATFICLILLAVTQGSSSQGPDPSQSVSVAINDVIREFFTANHIQFDLIVYGESSPHINDVIDRVTRFTQVTAPTTLKRIADIDRWDHKLHQSAVIFVKRTETLQALQRHAAGSNRVHISHLSNVEAKAFKFLVYTEDISTHEQLLKATNECSRVYVCYSTDLRHFELFLTGDASTIHLTANDVSTRHRVVAGTIVLQPRLLNSFDLSTQRWTAKLENYNHFSDFRGALVPFTINSDHMLYMENKKTITEADKFLPNDNFKFDGVAYELVRMMAERSNFVPHITLGISEYKKFYHVGSKNYAIEFGIKLLNSPVVLPWLHSTVPLGSFNSYYLVSLNDMYTNYEKLLFPFDSVTWMLLLVTFGLTFGIIFTLNRCPEWIRVIVSGAGVQHAGYNALGIFFGISQLQLPRETFSRCIWLLFIWFCLLFRTAYQSMMFEFMTTDMRKPLPESIEDLKRMNYTIALIGNRLGLNSSAYSFANEMILNGRESPRIVEYTTHDFMKLYNQSLHGELKSKFAFLVNTEMQGQLNFFYDRSLPVMRNEKGQTKDTIIVLRNHVLLQQINDILIRLMPSGILQHLRELGILNTFAIGDIEVTDPRRVLSMRDLEFGFVLWLIACFVSTACFVCELVLSLRLLERSMELIGLIDFMQALRTRMANYHGRW